MGALQARFKAFASELGRSPRFQIVLQSVSGSLLLALLLGVYWTIGVRGAALRSYLQFSSYLFLACVLFQLVFTGMRKPEPAQLRWINPFALAGSFAITFTFYVAIYGGDVARQTGTFLATVGTLLTILWYVSFLSRREVTIGEPRDAVGSTDGDFQIDTAQLVVAWFYKFVVLLQPLFLASQLLRPPSIETDLAGVMVGSWLRALAATVIMITIVSLTFLAIWARNIAKDVLTVEEDGTEKPIAGTGGRDDYPVYREQLAVSALPYCVFVPAMVFGLLALVDRLPLRIAGTGGVWLDGLVFVLLVLTLNALFVQLPYRAGSAASLQERADAHRRLRDQIEGRIAAAHAVDVPRRSASLDIIAGELTLRRLHAASRELRAQQTFKFKVFGEDISGGRRGGLRARPARYCGDGGRWRPDQRRAQDPRQVSDRGVSA
jgi:hypothetical protein